MRIAFDAKRALNNTSGLGNYSRTLLNGLMQSFPENEYQLFSPKVNEDLFAELHGAFKMQLPLSTLHKTIHPLWRSFGLKKQLQQSRAELYHGLSNELPFNAHTFRMAKVVTIHDLLYLHHPEDFPFIDRKMYQLKTSYACKNADVITVNSLQTKQDVIRLMAVPEKKVVLVYHAVQPRFLLTYTQQQIEAVRKQYQLPSSFILQTGSFLGRKNHLRTLKAFAAITDKTDCHLVFVGNGGTEQRHIENFITQHHLQSKVHIIKNIAAADMPLLYRAAKAVIYPSINEGFGLPILEAFTSNVPVITTVGKCFAEVAGDAAVFIDPFSENDIAKAMLEVIENNSLCEKLITSGNARLPMFSTEKLAEGNMNIYKSIV
jgi:glycosyltransferase involved in cell wall biosynthesis